MTMNTLCGMALIAVCVACILVSIKFCDGDITPVFVLIPLGMCAITEDKKAHKTENKKRI